jgi:lipoate-protein ligase A
VSLPVFGFVTVHREALAGGVAQEAAWCEQVAATGWPTAHLWRQHAALVVPRSYERRPGWARAVTESAAAGWPVQVRASGGGLVPQGPGLWNLSLVWAAPGSTPSATDEIYRALCGGLAAALARLGIVASAQAVAGSFCDGRFNLAVGGRKLVGTAQAWRRVAGRPVVLAHAVIIATAEPGALADVANRFEAASGGAPRYRCQAMTSVAEAWRSAHGDAPGSADLEARLVRAVAEQFARVAPPRVADPSATPMERSPP